MLPFHVPGEVDGALPDLEPALVNTLENKDEAMKYNAKELILHVSALSTVQTYVLLQDVGERRPTYGREWWSDD